MELKNTITIIVVTTAILLSCNQSAAAQSLTADDARYRWEADMTFGFNAHAHYVAWDVKTGINFQYDRLIVSLAYELTDMTLYSGLPVERHMRDNGKYLTHAGIIGIGYKF